MFFTITESNSENITSGFNTLLVNFKDIPNYVKKYAYCSNSLVNGVRAANKDKNLPTGIECYNGKEDVLILDIDDGATIENMKIFFGEFNYIIVTTKSHRKIKNGKMQGDRFRLFLEINKTINDYDTRVFIISEIYKTYFFIDQSVKSTNRFFYKSPEDAEVFYNITGNVFDVTKYEDVMDAIDFNCVLGTTVKKTKTDTPSKNIYKYDELKEIWIDEAGNVLEAFISEDGTNYEAKLKGASVVLENEFYNGNRANCIFKVAAMLKNDGLDDDSIANFLISENDKYDSLSLRELMSNMKSGLKR